jgi:hypothetical protein
MSIVGSNVLGGASSGGFTGKSSLKIPAGGVAYTFPGDADRQKFTFSFWVKSFMEGLPQGTNAGIPEKKSQFWLSTDTGPTQYFVRPVQVSMQKDEGDFTFFRWYTNSDPIYQEFRDVVSPVLTDAWMHVCVVYDSLNEDENLRSLVYINGVNLNVNYFVMGGKPGLGQLTTAMQSSTRLVIGQNFDSDNYDNNFLINDFHYVDGLALPPTKFGKYGELTGQWEPKIYRESHGTYGSYLDFSDGATAQSLLQDRSGNGNTWAGNVVPDAPAGSSTAPSRVFDSPMSRGKPFGNMAALNTVRSIGVPFNRPAVVASVTDAGYTFTSGFSSFLSFGGFDPNYNGWDQSYVPELSDFFGYGAYATHSIGPGMKIYYEVLITLDFTDYDQSFGIFLGPQNPMPMAWPFNMLRKTNNPFLAQRAGRFPFGYTGIDGNETHCYDPKTGNFWEYNNFSQAYTATSVSVAGTGDIIGVAADYTAGTISFYKNGVLVISTTATNPSNGDWLPGFTVPPNGSLRVNFGRYPFVYIPPVEHTALSSVAYPEPSILKSETQFLTFKDVGTGSTKDITGVDFQPVLIASHIDKTQSKTDYIVAYEDSLLLTSPTIDAAVPPAVLGNARAQPGTPKQLRYSSLPDSAGVVTFNTDGYTMGQNLEGGFNELRTNAGGSAYSYVQYLWKDSQVSPVVLNTGDVSTTSTLNSQAGISYVAWAGTQLSNAVRFPHNLGSTPEAIIFGAVGGGAPNSRQFYTLHKDRYSLVTGREDELQQAALGQRWQDLAGDNTYRYGRMYAMDANYFYGQGQPQQFTSPDVRDINQTGYYYWAMCIKSVRGFSKVGSYTGGNNGTREDPCGGVYVPTGFKPAWVLITGWDTTTTAAANNPNREAYSTEYLFVDNGPFYPQSPIPTALNTYTMGQDPMGDDLTGSASGQGAFVTFSAAGFTVSSRQGNYQTAGERPLNIMGQNFHYIAFAQAPTKYAVNGLLKRFSAYTP